MNFIVLMAAVLIFQGLLDSILEDREYKTSNLERRLRTLILAVQAALEFETQSSPPFQDAFDLLQVFHFLSNIVLKSPRLSSLCRDHRVLLS